MESYITNCIAGFIAFDEDYSIINFKLFEEEKIPEKIIKNLDDEIAPEEKELIEEMPDKFDTIFIESNKAISNYKDIKNYGKLKISNPNKGGEYLRNSLMNILVDLGFSSESEFKSKIIAIYTKIANLKMKKSSQEEDKLLIQAINSIDEIDESISKLIERIREWYTIYFPELDIIQNNESYINLIAEVGDREKIIKDYSNSFKLDVDISNGADIEDEDLEMITHFSKSIQSLQKSRKEIEKYIDMKMDKIAPNLKNLVGASIGAKLISHVGGVKKLAMYPSGTIQILGAEKALFRHIKTGDPPPKHGLIFQHPEVRTSPWWIRGKIARLLALKISLSIRKDVFSQDFDSSIAEVFLKKIEEIKKDNPFPKKTKKRREEERKNRHSKKSEKFENKKMKKRKRRKKK